MARQVPAVARAFEILELFLEHDELSQAGIVSRLGLPRTSVHGLVNTLLKRGYLARSSTADRRVRLGPRVFELGSRYADGLDLAREGESVARLTSARCQETVQVMVRDTDQIIDLAKVDSAHSVRLVSAAGRRVPAHCTAGGKVLLAAMPDDEFNALFARKRTLPSMTTNSITDLPTLRGQLDRVRQEGIGWEYCESNEAIACVAAAVRDATGSVVAAMSISVPTIRWSDAVKPQLAHTVRTGALELSRRLGHTDATPDEKVRLDGATEDLSPRRPPRTEESRR
jgi:IclR family transcriptional regulator, KDG regulon repressor